MNREEWLMVLAQKMAPRYASFGHPLPTFKISCGFTSAGRRSKAIGECWDNEASQGNLHEIFVRPSFNDAVEVAAVVAHELAHAAVGIKENHGPKFQRLVRMLGLVGPAKGTRPGPGFVAWITPFLEELGEYPHSPLDDMRRSDKPVQKTFMKKLLCPECGYMVRTTQKWIDIGLPFCPTHETTNLELAD